MKKKSVFIGIAIFSAGIVLHSCAKKEGTNLCRTCNARYNNETVATIEACSSSAEEEFKSAYYYAEVSCR
jgi:hypothetical protein